MTATTSATQDYRNLSACGGYALDRPGTYKELMDALKARVAVAEEAGACAEYFHSSFDFYRRRDEMAKADEIVRNARWIFAFPVVGPNEGYYVHVCATNEGGLIDLALVKVLGSREDVQRISHEINELLLRM